jgi:UDP-N-acetylmuramoyl-tripeptide--D-alanyl-D-alanine ligase
VRRSIAIVEAAPQGRSAAGEPGFDGQQLAATVDGRLVHPGGGRIRGGAVDSRRVAPGNAFFALPGERTDGHRFLAQAVAAGAGALVVRAGHEAELPALPDAVSAIAVADPAAALRAAARAWRERFSPLVVGVTGSIAKTSTKEQAAEVLSERWVTLRSEGNENNEIGLPLTLLRLGPEHEAAVLEMGFYEPREIALLADLARPRIGVVTAVRGVHLSRAGSIDAIERGKRELVEALPADGTAVLNADDPRVARMAGHTQARTIRYGFTPGSDVTADAVRSLGPEGMAFRLRLPDRSLDVISPALGRHSVHNALAAAAVGVAAGLDATTIANGLERRWRIDHRTHLIRLPEGMVLDDSYNASPDTMIAALDLLATLPGRHVAVLGAMLELGDAAPEAHRRVGEHAARLVDRLVVVGDGARRLAEAARAAGLDRERVSEVPDRDTALALLRAEARPGDTILVKASRGAELDLLVADLVADRVEGALA